jgi:hypothetical protein
MKMTEVQLERMNISDPLSCTVKTRVMGYTTKLSGVAPGKPHLIIAGTSLTLAGLPVIIRGVGRVGDQRMNISETRTWTIQNDHRTLPSATDMCKAMDQPLFQTGLWYELVKSVSKIIQLGFHAPEASFRCV